MDATPCKTGPHRWLVAGLAALALLAACSRQAPASHPPEPGDVAVATVDGQAVWASDVRREAATQGLIGQGAPLDITTDLFHRVLDEVIDQKLLSAEALKHHLENDPIAKQRLAAARERILADVLVERLVEQAVSDSSIKSLYAEQVQLSRQGEEFHARQIVVASPTDAAAIKQQLAGGAAFDSLAMERSIDADTRYNGGDLGYFTIDVMPPAYSAALANAKPGDLVGPFKTDAGWALLKVEDRRPEQPVSLDAARPQIVNFLTDEQVGDLLKRLRSKSKIQVMIPPANPDEPGALHEPASAPPEAAEAPASAPPLSAQAPAASAAPPVPITLAPP
ncbi:MAG TPA: peptidyl-prolyl cis-trans isomerase, partial [Caulobacteraceae bacterium]|nr:peptidyl-prolyl cis-trans isomerase [Caulobacteraceae bacterium]